MINVSASLPVLLCLLAGAASAATLSASPANLLARVKAAQPGDVVQLQGGVYPPMGLVNIVKASPGVTITPAPGAVVTTSAINANGSSNLIFNGIEVAMTPTSGYGVQANGAGMVFRRMKVHQADNQSVNGSGFWMRNASGPVIEHNEVSWVGNGITLMDSPNAVVTGNVLHDIGVDGIDLAGADHALVTGNTATNFHQVPGAHPDFIQWWRTPATSQPCGMTIENNRFDRGTGTVTQGIFGEDGCKVTIKGNVLRGTMYNGIALARTAGVVISGNFVDGYPDMQSRLFIRGGCDQIEITSNAAQSITNYGTATEKACTNVTITNNTILKPAPFGDDTLLNAWIARRKPLAGVSAPEGLHAGGAGAAMVNLK